MNLRYGLDDRPPPIQTILYALQWLALSLPFVVIVGTVAAGGAAFAGGAFTFEDGLVIGLPLMAGTVTALLPESALADFPAFARSVAGNGFVVGVVAVLLLDRLFRRPAQKA